jgi:hypothetical protein
MVSVHPFAEKKSALQSHAPMTVKIVNVVPRFGFRFNVEA